MYQQSTVPSLLLARVYPCRSIWSYGQLSEDTKDVYLEINFKPLYSQIRKDRYLLMENLVDISKPPVTHLE